MEFLKDPSMLAVIGAVAGAITGIVWLVKVIRGTTQDKIDKLQKKTAPKIKKKVDRANSRGPSK